MEPDSADKLHDFARLLANTEKYVQGLPSEDAGVVHLFFVPHLSIAGIQRCCAMRRARVRAILTDCITGLWPTVSQLPRFAVCVLTAREVVRYLLPGPNVRRVENQSATTCAEHHVLALLALAEDFRELVGMALQIHTPSIPPAVRDRILSKMGAARASKELGNDSLGSAGRDAKSSKNDETASPEVSEEHYGLCLEVEFDRLLRARENRVSDRASRLIYGPDQVAASGRANPEFSIRFTQNHLRLLQQAVEGKLAGYEGTPAERVFHKVETVCWGLRCCELAYGTEALDEKVWIEPLATGLDEGKRLLRSECAGLVVDCFLLCQDVLFRGRRPEARKRAIQEIVRNLGKIVAIFGGSWAELCKELNHEQQAEGGKEKRVEPLCRELRSYQQSLWLPDDRLSLLFTHRQGGTDFGTAVVIVARRSPFCDGDRFVGICQDALAKVGLKATARKVELENPDSFVREVLRPNRPFFAVAEASGFKIGGLGEEEPRRCQGTLQRLNRFLVSRRALRWSDEEIPPYVFLYEGADLEDQVRQVVSELPAIYNLDIEMSDEQGTLSRVIDGVTRLGANIIESRTWTVEKGELARLRVVLELPSRTDWEKFRSALERDFQDVATIRHHEVAFAPTSTLPPFGG